MGGISSQSPAVLKKTTGAANVGSSDGQTVEQRLDSLDTSMGAAQSAITDEATARAAADGVLADAITDEETARAAADGVLADAITNEAGARVLGDALTRVERTSNVQLVAADSGDLTDVTSGTFTQTFAAASVLGDGWFRYYQNSGTGDVTLDPFDTETIDGLTSFVMYPGEARLIYCDGTALRSIVLHGFSATITTSSNFIKPPGYTFFEGELWGAGGSGRKDSANFRYGGGGGGCAQFILPYATLSASNAVVIGAGGAAVSAASTNGNPGGNSTFAGITAYGGLGGTNTEARSGGPAFISGATSAAYGSASNDPEGAYLGGGSGSISALNGNTVWGGSAGQMIFNDDLVRTHATTVFGGAGGAASISGTAASGTAPGGGGGATSTGTSGAGARGELRIRGVV